MEGIQLVRLDEYEERNQEIDNNINNFSRQLEQIKWLDTDFAGITIVGHRGYPAQYPESTLKSYQEAIRLGLRAIECDPWTTSDDHWVDIHDPTVDRTTNGTGRVDEMTLAQIRALKIDGGNNASIFKGLKIPLVDEIFSLASNSKQRPIVFLNNRTSTPINAQRTKDLAAIIKKYNYETRTMLFIGDFNSFDGLRKELPSVGICYDFTGFTPTDAELDRLASYYPNVMASLDASVLFGANGTNVIKKCKDRNIIVQAHTIDSISQAKTLIDNGVNFILSNTIISI